MHNMMCRNYRKKWKRIENSNSGFAVANSLNLVGLADNKPEGSRRKVPLTLLDNQHNYAAVSRRHKHQ